jgi:hypothetical protein
LWPKWPSTTRYSTTTITHNFDINVNNSDNMKITIVLLCTLCMVGLSLGAPPALPGCDCITVSNSPNRFTVSFLDCPSGLSHVNVPATLPTTSGCPSLSVTLVSTTCPGVQLKSGERYCTNSDITVPPAYYQIQGLAGHNCEAVFQYTGPSATVGVEQIFVKERNDCAFCSGTGTVPPCPATCPTATPTKSHTPTPTKSHTPTPTKSPSPSPVCTCGNGVIDCDEECDCKTVSGTTTCVGKGGAVVDEACCHNCKLVGSGQPCKINPTPKATAQCVSTLCGPQPSCCATESPVPCCVKKERTCTAAGKCEETKCTVSRGSC